MYQRNLLIKLAGFSLGLLLGTAGLISGCAARLNQFNTSSQAGISYVTASQSVIQAAGTAAVNMNTVASLIGILAKIVPMV